MEDGNGDGTENGSGDEDGERRRETGLRTVPETRMKDGSGDESGEQG